MKAWWTRTHDTVLDNDTLKGFWEEVFRLFALCQVKKWPCRTPTLILVGHAERKLLCAESPPLFISHSRHKGKKKKTGSGLWSDVTRDSRRRNKSSWHRCRSDRFHHKSPLFKRQGVWWQDETAQQSRVCCDRNSQEVEVVLHSDGFCWEGLSRADCEHKDAF